MAISPHYKHTFVYLVVAGGLVTYATYTIVAYEIFPPGLDGRQLYFIDMMDADNIKAYEQPMRALPEGVVSRDRYVPNYDKASAEGKALTHQYSVDQDFLDQGEWMYQTYCTPCHGNEGQGMGLVTDASKGKRFAIPGPPLVGKTGVLQNYPDGHIYLTIRNGGAALMPGYSWAMDDEEMWSIVEYLRTQPGGAYVPPQPAAGLEPADEAQTEEG